MNLSRDLLYSPKEINYIFNISFYSKYLSSIISIKAANSNTWGNALSLSNKKVWQNAFQTLPWVATDSLNWMLFILLPQLVMYINNLQTFQFICLCKNRLLVHVTHYQYVLLRKTNVNSIPLLLEWLLEVLTIESAKWEVEIELFPF